MAADSRGRRAPRRVSQLYVISVAGYLRHISFSSRRVAHLALVVGFAAETDHVEDHARAKLARKGCDWIIANDVTEPGVMGGGENAVLLVTKDNVERWDRAAKDQVAARIAQRIAAALA